jgi:hypothetical protein
MWETVSQENATFSKSHHEISLTHPMSDLELLDILLGPSSRQNNNNEVAMSSVKRSGYYRNRTMSCSSVVMDDFQGNCDDGVERWEAGESLDRCSPFAQTNQFLRETVSEPGTPNKLQVNVTM